MASKTVQGEGWQVQVVAYEGLAVEEGAIAHGNIKLDQIDKLLEAVGKFAEEAGVKLNDMEVCPSELTIEGHVSLDVGGGVLLFGVSAGISVSMTWKFQAMQPGRHGR